MPVVASPLSCPGRHGRAARCSSVSLGLGLHHHRERCTDPGYPGRGVAVGGITVLMTSVASRAVQAVLGLNVAPGDPIGHLILADDREL